MKKLIALLLMAGLVSLGGLGCASETKPSGAKGETKTPVMSKTESKKAPE